MVCNFQNGESFSPFLLISWDPTRWGDVLVEGVGYGLFKPLVKWVMFGSTPPPRRTSPHLVGSHEMRRNGEKLSPFLKSHEMERSSPGGVGVWSNPTRRQNPARFLANICQCCYYQEYTAPILSKELNFFLNVSGNIVVSILLQVIHFECAIPDA